jgi:hypothetical protein
MFHLLVYETERTGKITLTPGLSGNLKIITTEPILTAISSAKSRSELSFTIPDFSFDISL